MEQNYKTTIVVNLQFEGIHSWPKCPLEDVAFLRHPHRHIFHVRCEKAVTHDDRDIEIIRFKRKIEKYIKGIFPFREMGSTSCEMLAVKLLKKFDLENCEVLEDGENGAKVYK